MQYREYLSVPFPLHFILVLGLEVGPATGVVQVLNGGLISDWHCLTVIGWCVNALVD